MTKTFFYIMVFLLLIFYMLPSGSRELTDPVRGGVHDQFLLKRPAFYLEPLTGISYYFLGMYDKKQQLVSWLLWILFFNLAAAIFLNGVNLKKMFGNLYLSMLVFLVFISYTVFFPFPKYRVSTLDDACFIVDPQSHTVYSHDGLAGIRKSRRWHRKHGFHGYFITDHNTVAGAEKTLKLKKKPADPAVFKGEEIQDAYGNALVLLGTDKSASGFCGGETSEISDFVHEQGGAVIVGHWWGQKGSTLQELKDAGVDGFEVYGHTGKPLTGDTRGEIVRFCTDNGLAMTGGSNWHGLGERNDVWTSFRIPGWAGMDRSGIRQEIVSILRRGENDRIDVIVLSGKEPVSGFRYIFEPFAGIYFYFKKLEFPGLIAWFAWIALLRAAILLYRNMPGEFKPPVRAGAFIAAGSVMLAAAFAFLVRWYFLDAYNEALFDMARAHFIIGILLLLFTLGKIRNKPASFYARNFYIRKPQIVRQD